MSSTLKAGDVINIVFTESVVLSVDGSLITAQTAYSEVRIHPESDDVDIQFVRSGPCCATCSCDCQRS